MCTCIHYPASYSLKNDFFIRHPHTEDDYSWVAPLRQGRQNGFLESQDAGRQMAMMDGV